MDSFCRWSGCNLKFDSVSCLVDHINDLHLNILNNDNNICLWDGCDRLNQPFHNRASLNAHIRRHTGERPFKCIQCQKSFSRSDALTKHIKSHSGINYGVQNVNLSLNEQFGPIDYILKNALMENLSLKRKLYFNDLKRNRLQSYKFSLLEAIRKKLDETKLNSEAPL